MVQVNIHEAKTHLAALVEKASEGEPFIIAKAGRPLVIVNPYTPAESMPPTPLYCEDTPSTALRGQAHCDPCVARRTGFLKGRIAVPADFDDIGKAEIERVFGVAE